MLKTSQLTLAGLISALCISSACASEQSEAKGFVEGASVSVLARNGYIGRNKENRPDTHSWGQSFILNAESGFTPGIVGFGVDVLGDFSFKLGANRHTGDFMIPRDADGKPRDQWTRGGGSIKARFSNTTVRYGTQLLDYPVISGITNRLVPEYFVGTLITSQEIKDLDLVAGKFTKNQLPNQISTDGNDLGRAYIWGAKYKVNSDINLSYFGLDVKDRLTRHYASADYKQKLDNDSSLTYTLNGYHTRFGENANTYSATGNVAPDYGNTGVAGEVKKNNIWAFSTAYNHGAHTAMVAYQQNTGDVGYDYGGNADGGSSIYLPNSYLSDFVGNREKSAQIQYNLDFGKLNVAPGLTWTTAYVYGWNIHVNGDDNANEREFFNQVSYKVQSGFAKDLNIRVRNSIYRASQAYETAYLGDMSEWRIFVDFPIKLL